MEGKIEAEGENPWVVGGKSNEFFMFLGKEQL